MAEQLSISTKNCTIEKDGNIIVVTLNRPESKNALSPEMLVGMYKAWRLLDEDINLYCAVLKGQGGTFCAGMDMRAKPEDAENADEIKKVMAEVPNMHFKAMLREGRPGKPIIAAVEGYCLAGGMEIMLGTDLRVMDEDAKLGLTEVLRGLYPLGGGPIRVTRQINSCLAAEVLLTGRWVTAQEALQWGLINRVATKGTAVDGAMQLARQIAENAPLSIKAITKTIHEIDASFTEEEAMKKMDAIGMPLFATEDSIEGMKAFKEKRKPVWKGR